MDYPLIIQGGMGAGVSNWRLAKAVSKSGQLGVVSGTAQPDILARILQLGDPDGHYRRAIEHFPFPEIAQDVLDKLFIPGGKSSDESFKRITKFTQNPDVFLQALTILGTYTEVFLAKENHTGGVGINLLEKVLFPNLLSLYGAMLADVDYVIMGAGIPKEIPEVLDRLAKHQPVSLKIPVEGAAPDDNYMMQLIPSELSSKRLPDLKRPIFLGIISSNTLALMLAKKASGKVDGFIVEGFTAGGHNAPPRGKMVLNDKKEPIYSERDLVDFKKLKKLGLPFWLAGSYGSPQKLAEALDMGAEGIQVGTAFAFCDESGFSDRIKNDVIRKTRQGYTEVLTDAKASPTGYPFKVISLENSLSEEQLYNERPRICDLGYLRVAYKKPDGTLGYRCPAEPIAHYVRKGGRIEDTVGRKCLCNGLLANIDLAQLQHNGYVEKPFVTAGYDIDVVRSIMTNGRQSYSAADVIDRLLMYPKYRDT